MPSALIEVPVDWAHVGPSRKRWTRAECAALEASGLLNQQHLELVEEELIDKMGKNRPYVNGLSLMYAWLADRRLIVHRYPEPGKYTVVLVYSQQEAVAPIAAPQAMFKAAEAFPG